LLEIWIYAVCAGVWPPVSHTFVWMGDIRFMQGQNLRDPDSPAVHLSKYFGFPKEIVHL